MDAFSGNKLVNPPAHDILYLDLCIYAGMGKRGVTPMAASKRELRKLQKIVDRIVAYKEAMA